jgi:hypothetical protein
MDAGGLLLLPFLVAAWVLNHPIWIIVTLLLIITMQLMSGFNLITVNQGVIDSRLRGMITEIANLKTEAESLDWVARRLSSDMEGIKGMLTEYSEGHLQMVESQSSLIFGEVPPGWSLKVGERVIGVSGRFGGLVEGTIVDAPDEYGQLHSKPKLSQTGKACLIQLDSGDCVWARELRPVQP